MTAALEATGLGKRYRREWALRDCTVRVPAGRVTALVGPNGAGKTTLLLLAMGLCEPTEGSIEVLGMAPSTTSSDLAARVGFIAQDHPLYRSFSVEDTLHVARRLSRRWDDAQARRRLGELGIPLQRRVGRLSGGQQAQVALAVALARRPELLLLDEPLASLDPLAREQFLQVLLDAVAADGLSVMFSSHVISELEPVCDHLVLLCGGHVQVTGDVDTLLATHRRMVGPRRDGHDVAGVRDVVDAHDAARQTSMLVRLDDRPIDPSWTVAPVALRDLVLGYMRRPQTSALPEPELVGATSEGTR